MNPSDPPQPSPAVSQHPQALAPRVAFVELSNGRREVFIEHADQVYRLSLTAQNKLILTK